MNPLLLNRNVFIFLFVESVAAAAVLLSLFVVVRLLLRWDFQSFTPRQYRLEKEAYLVMSAIGMVFAFKLVLLPYFIFTIDALSEIVPGAMCAAGVISFNRYGLWLLALKPVILFLLTLWMVINRYDLDAGNYPWFRLKHGLFVVIFLLIAWELLLDFRFFESIDVHAVLNCCSTLYGLLEGMNPLPFGLDITVLVALFYATWLLILSTRAARMDVLHAAALLLFGYLAYYAVLYFFGTYIYEAPEHNCPFCMFQRDYRYVGYPLWGTLAGGVFLGLGAVFAERVLKADASKLHRISLWLIGAFVLLCSFYVAHYYYANGTFLQPGGGEIRMSMPM